VLHVYRKEEGRGRRLVRAEKNPLVGCGGGKKSPACPRWQLQKKSIVVLKKGKRKVGEAGRKPERKQE